MTIGEGVIRLCAAAMMVGILLALIPEGTTRKLAALVGSLMLTMSALSALTDWQLPDLSIRPYLEEGMQAAAVGEELAHEAWIGRIKELLESYILDKGTALDAQVEAEITLNGNGEPETVSISGNYSPLARQRLSRILTQELGIPKEKQQWILPE